MRFAIALFVFLLLEILIVAFFYLRGGPPSEVLNGIMGYTHRLALIVFSAIFLLQHNKAALQRWFSNQFYLLFAVVYGIHLVALLIFMYEAGADFIPFTVAAYLAGYALTFAMPMLQEFAFMRKIRETWFLIAERWFAYYLWLMFFIYYYKEVGNPLNYRTGQYKESIVLLGWVSILLGYRMSRLMRRPRTRN